LKTVVITSLKGGSGKSTITVNLAVVAEGAVALVDTDHPQGSASHWFNVRKAETPVFADSFTPTGIDYLFVDTPPKRPDPEIIEIADLVIIPVKPSPMICGRLVIPLPSLSVCRSRFALRSTWQSHVPTLR
jgi:chromosome partitioning protein